jgi:hypothetical protein
MCGIQWLAPPLLSLMVMQMMDANSPRAYTLGWELPNVVDSAPPQTYALLPRLTRERGKRQKDFIRDSHTLTMMHMLVHIRSYASKR